MQRQLSIDPDQEAVYDSRVLHKARNMKHVFV